MIIKKIIDGFLFKVKKMEDLKIYYSNVLASGKKYKELLLEPLNSNVALLIQETIDDIEYNVKLYHQTLRKKRQLTDEEKEMLEFRTPKQHTLEYFHTKRKYPSLNEYLKKLILKMKEREEKEIEKNCQVIFSNNVCSDNNIQSACEC